jgi:RNA-binding protein
MAMTGKERAALRAHAHHLSATVHVGQAGLTRALVHSLDDALRTHELVKVQLVKNADVTAKQAANELAEAVKADVVQVIGRTTTLYRRNPELDHGAGKAPAWAR